MTPAQKLAGSKRRQRPQRNPTATKVPRKIVWVTSIREYREGLNLSIRDVAKELGLSLSGYWCMELGAEVTLTNVLKISTFFGVPIPKLWLHPKEGA